MFKVSSDGLHMILYSDNGNLVIMQKITESKEDFIKFLDLLHKLMHENGETSFVIGSLEGKNADEKFELQSLCMLIDMISQKDNCADEILEKISHKFQLNLRTEGKNNINSDSNSDFDAILNASVLIDLDNPEY
jgi:hypothetical protein